MKWKAPYIFLTLVVTSMIIGKARQTQFQFFELRGGAATVQLLYVWFLVNDQIDAQFFSMYSFQFSTYFEQPRAHHQENQLYQYNIWYMSPCVGDHSVCRPESFLSDLHTKRLPTQINIYQMLCWYNWFSWWWARGCSKHVENWNKYIEKKYASSWSYTKNRNKMHVQQNIIFRCICWSFQKLKFNVVPVHATR